MKLNIKEIGPEARRLQRQLGDAEVRALLGGVDLDLASGETSVELDVELRRVQGCVMLHGAIDGVLWTCCSRCLAPAPVQVKEPNLRRTFLPPEMFEQQAEPEQELAAEDLEVSTHDGATIDIASMVRECLLLAVPIAPLCKADCSGPRADEQRARGTGSAEIRSQDATDADDSERGPDLPSWKRALSGIKAGPGSN